MAAVRSGLGNLFFVAALAVALAVAMPRAFADSSAANSVVVATDTGPVRGLATPTLDLFLGIPYAAPPVGSLRWRPPQPHERWTAPRDAIAFGATCAQTATLGAGNQNSAAEDCLFLNVFTPGRADLDEPAMDGRENRSASGAGSRLPVMVFLHGGGFFTGASNGYIPSKLVANGSVVVTVNYRLGILGFLTHPALTAESGYHGSGNYGLMDQQLALDWVRRNIAQFGGDPNNVTLFGQSAGGASVHAQLASPLASELFHRAIVESGAYTMTQPSVATAETLGRAIAGAAGCADQSAACLRALSIPTILAVQSVALANGVVPTVDGYVLPRTIQSAFATGRFNRVPVIEGSNHDEWREFVAVAELTSGHALPAAGYFGAISATLGVSPSLAAFIGTIFYPLQAYGPANSAPSVALGALGTDVAFACNAELSTWLMASYVPVFQYEFNDPAAPLPLGVVVSFPGGSYHAAELPYLFDPAPLGFPALGGDQNRLSDTMVRYWTSFARSGYPNTFGDPAWPAYAMSYATQSLEPPTPVTRRTFDADHHCELWTTF